MTRYALLVGVSDYEEADFKHLPGAVRDAEEISKILQDPAIGNFPKENVVLLKNPDRYEVEEAIYDLFAERSKSELVLFYFSGHGVTDNLGQLYFTARSTRKSKRGIRDVTAISARYLQEKMSQSPSEQQVIILDCCFSGAFAKGMTARGADVVNIQAQLGGRGRAVLASSTSTQYSFDHKDSGLGIYTHYLLEGLQDGAADRDRNGFISVDELHDYISGRVKQYCVEQNIDPPISPEIYAAREGYKIPIFKAKTTSVFPTVLASSNESDEIDEMEIKLFLAREALIDRDFRKAEYLGKQVIEFSDLEKQKTQANKILSFIYHFQDGTSKNQNRILDLGSSVTSPLFLSSIESEHHNQDLALGINSTSSQNVDYTSLLKSLQECKWHKADQETFVLMLRLASLERELFFRDGSIDKFPCDILQDINQLWKDYSNGKFGFSIQRKIYQNQNGDFFKFAEKVGWAEEVDQKKKWLSYNARLALTSIPNGHFPSSWLLKSTLKSKKAIRRGKFRAQHFFDLVQRLQNCQIQ